MPQTVLEHSTGLRCAFVAQHSSGPRALAARLDSLHAITAASGRGSPMIAQPVSLHQEDLHTTRCCTPPVLT